MEVCVKYAQERTTMRVGWANLHKNMAISSKIADYGGSAIETSRAIGD